MSANTVMECGCRVRVQSDGRAEIDYCSMHGAAPEMKTALRELLGRIEHDARVAYYFDPITESFHLLTRAFSLASGLEAAEFQKTFRERMRFERPRCRECLHCQEVRQ